MKSGRLAQIIVVTMLSVFLTHLADDYLWKRARALTAEELFNLRSKCAELGNKMIEGESDERVLNLATSRYDATSNRCYVLRTMDINGGGDSGGATFHFLHDGQTGTVLARTLKNMHGEFGWLTDKQTGEQVPGSYEHSELYMQQMMADKDQSGDTQ